MQNGLGDLNLDSQPELMDMTTEIVSAYVANNTVAQAALPELIKNVYHTLQSIDGTASAPPPAQLKPAVPIAKSITKDFLICLEDGQKFKSLKRHLRTHYDMSPEDYREKWGLAKDYPMVAPNYAETRSALAKKMGLGQKRKTATRSAPRTKRRK